MLRLSAFGGVALTRDGVPVVGAAGGRRRLAILVLLAASGDRGVSRETLAAMLWPDSNASDARHSLDQALYATHTALGADDLFLGTGTVHLNSALITCDVWEFEVALQSRQLEHAVKLYRGAFADGLVVKGAPEVERRIDTIRAGFTREWWAAVEALARAASARGDHALSARWWHRLADDEPLNTRVAKELIAELVAAREAVRALRFALVHESLVKQETGGAPDPEIGHWIRRLRAQDNGPLAREIAPSTQVGVGRVSAPDAIEPLRQRRATRLANALGRRYRLEQLIEEGSIIESYAAATTETVGEQVEIHLLQPRVATMSTADRFVASLRRAASLTDPRVLPILDVGAADDLLFFVTARRTRLSLRDRLRNERALPVADAMAIAQDIAAALAHAHSCGVHHGDLRPKHVSLTGASALVGGFGVVEGFPEAAGWSTRTTMIALGSPAYLSPEQLSGEVQVDARSDVYAFGCILYEMLAGEPPFGRPSRALIGRKLSEQPPLLRRHRESVPELIENITHKCLMRVPADRYATGEEITRALVEARRLI